jgi:hypothetical protein
MTTGVDAEGRYWWVEAPPGTDAGTCSPHGPFRTEAEEDFRVTTFGRDCKFTDAGMWDPAWNKKQ